MPGLGELGARFRGWLEQNPEAVAKILLWLEESSAAAPEEGRPERGFLDQILPSNWQGMRVGVLQETQTLMEETGLCLVWVPGLEVIEALLGAPDRDRRDAVLLANEDGILTAVDSTLALVAHPQLRDLRLSVAEAALALRADLGRASQALSAAAITSILEGHYGFGFGGARQAFEEEGPASAGLWSARRVWVQASLHRAILRADQVPAEGGFNRHATAHNVEDGQYSRVNSIVGLLLATGALRELQEMYRVGERGFAPTPHLHRLASPDDPALPQESGP